LTTEYPYVWRSSTRPNGPARRPVAEAAHSSHQRDTESAYPEIVAPALQWSCAYSAGISQDQNVAHFDHARPDPRTDRLKVLGEHACAAGTVPCVDPCGCMDRRQAKNLGRVARRATRSVGSLTVRGRPRRTHRSTVGTFSMPPCSASEQGDGDAQGDERHSAEHQ
jgi:hypothetical protein